MRFRAYKALSEAALRGSFFVYKSMLDISPSDRVYCFGKNFSQ